MRLDECPRKCVGKLANELTLVKFAMHDKLLPEAGGINDQDARFVALWQAFRSDVNMIEREEAERGK